MAFVRADYRQAVRRRQSHSHPAGHLGGPQVRQHGVRRGVQLLYLLRIAQRIGCIELRDAHDAQPFIQPRGDKGRSSIGHWTTDHA